MMKRIVVYGSYKKNSRRGWRYKGKDKQIYLRDILLTDFEMYDMGGYPAICEGDGNVKCEIHMVSDEIFTEIKSERLLNRFDEAVMEIDGIDCVFFTKEKKDMGSYPRVLDGDWS
jgi:gamma-glutamylcyclotransferase (GGCT)/AIG2-like uncharacterized protein YtfP